jgi:small subunit ribosomal protein S19e
MGIQDVPAIYLVEEISKKLGSEIKAPETFMFLKTGVHRERAPTRSDWVYMRMGSILYRAFKWGNIGTERLRTYYGGKRNRGLKREHFFKAGGKVLRVCVQSLEKAGYLERAQPKGRKLTSKGLKLLNETSKLVEKNLAEGKYITKEKVLVDNKKRKEVQEALKGRTAPMHGAGSSAPKDQTKKAEKKGDQ